VESRLIRPNKIDNTAAMHIFGRENRCSKLHDPPYAWNRAPTLDANRAKLPVRSDSRLAAISSPRKVSLFSGKRSLGAVSTGWITAEYGIPVERSLPLATSMTAFPSSGVSVLAFEINARQPGPNSRMKRVRASGYSKPLAHQRGGKCTRSRGGGWTRGEGNAWKTDVEYSWNLS
jgi:hypothetical protein